MSSKAGITRDAVDIMSTRQASLSERVMRREPGTNRGITWETVEGITSRFLLLFLWMNDDYIYLACGTFY